jgi:hypothetical protein
MENKLMVSIEEIIDQIQGCPKLLFTVAARRVTLQLPTYRQCKPGSREVLASTCLFGNEGEEAHTGLTLSEKGYYHCYGCCAHGDVVRLLQEVFDYNFEQSIEYSLANKNTCGELPRKMTQSWLDSEMLPLLGSPL